MGAQGIFAAVLAAILVSSSLQTYTGPTCDKQVEPKHRGTQLKGPPPGTVYKTKPQPTTTTTVKPGVKPKCVVPFQGNPDVFEWLQVLEETGGQPGKVNATRNKIENYTEYDNPCERPLSASDREAEKLYSYKHTDFKKIFRDEDAYLRFAGTKSEFLDVRGFVVWTPPKEAYDPRVYIADYRLDDTGLWLDVRKSNCTFDPKPSLYCKGLPTCRCTDDDELRCKENRVVSPNLMASLIGIIWASDGPCRTRWLLSSFRELRFQLLTAKTVCKS